MATLYNYFVDNVDAFGCVICNWMLWVNLRDRLKSSGAGENVILGYQTYVQGREQSPSITTSRRQFDKETR
ncbi:hypothetical protein HDU76_013682 [Blyttiomyces sp. JEL0837]|nr:hypothetical protein HDU76_013682 [Blyttiomyces sp. JEL0837]